MITNLFLELDASNFWIVNWYYIAAVSISAFAAITGYRNFKKKSPSKDGSELHLSALKESSSNNTNNNSNNVTVNLGHFQKESEPIANNKTEEEVLRKNITILFIDDDTKFKVVKILINEGWTNTKSIVDLKSYNDEALRNSDIVFVDIQGVGKLLDCKDEGLGLALNIKSKYPKKKVVIYSAIQGHNLFHEAIQKVDFLLSKDAEPYEFISLIERLTKEIE